MKKHHFTIALLALFFAGLIWLSWANYTGIPTAKERETWSLYVLPQLSNVPETAIHKIEIQSPKETVVLERRGRERWQITKPIDTAADGTLVSTVARNLKEMRKSRDAGSIEGSAKSFGLDPPAATVQIYGGEKNELIATLQVGEELKGFEDRRYVRSSGEDETPRVIDLVDARFLGVIGKPANAWRDKTLFNSPTFYVSEVKVTGPGRDVEAKREEGHWRLLSPVRAPADDDKIEGILAEVTSLRVAEGDKGFVADGVKDLKPYGLDKPDMTVELKTAWGGGETQTVLFGSPVPGKEDLVYAMRKDQDDVVMISGKELHDIGKGKNTLRSRHVADEGTADANFIEVHAFGRDLRVSRAASGWYQLGPEREKAEESFIKNLLMRLAKSQTMDFFEPASITDAGLNPPRMTIKVWEAKGSDKTPKEPATESKGKPAVDLEIGRYDALKRTVFARVAGDSTILALPSDFNDALPKNAFAFRERKVPTFGAGGGQISKLIIERGGETYVLEPPARSSKSMDWRMTRPIEARADTGEVSKTVAMLSELRAVEFVSDQVGDGKAFGLDKPTLTVTWEVEAGSISTEFEPKSAEPKKTTTGTLRLGFQASGGENVYANVVGNPMVFTLSADAVQPFKEEFRDHVVMKFAPDKVRRLILRWPERALSFVPKAGSVPGAVSWEPELGLDASGFDLSRLDSLVRSLAQLSTPRFAQYLGILSDSYGLTPPRLSIEVQLEGEAGSRTLRLGKQSPEGPLYATVENGSAGAVFLLPGPAWPELLRTPKRSSDLPDNVFAPSAGKKP